MSDPILQLEVTVKFTIENAISDRELSRGYGYDPMRYAKFLIEEEGLASLIEDDWQIVKVTARKQP